MMKKLVSTWPDGKMEKMNREKWKPCPVWPFLKIPPFANAWLPIANAKNFVVWCRQWENILKCFNSLGRKRPAQALPCSCLECSPSKGKWNMWCRIATLDIQSIDLPIEFLNVPVVLVITIESTSAQHTPFCRESLSSKASHLDLFHRPNLEKDASSTRSPRENPAHMPCAT